MQFLFVIRLSNWILFISIQGLIWLLRLGFFECYFGCRTKDRLNKSGIFLFEIYMEFENCFYAIHDPNIQIPKKVLEISESTKKKYYINNIKSAKKNGESIANILSTNKWVTSNMFFFLSQTPILLLTNLQFQITLLLVS